MGFGESIWLGYFGGDGGRVSERVGVFCEGFLGVLGWKLFLLN